MDKLRADINPNINRKVNVDIAEGNMLATVCLDFITALEDNYTEEEIKAALNDAGVKMGIKDSEIARIVSDRIFCESVVVAEGKKAEDGEDGYFQLFFDVESNGKPVISEDGSTDYYNIKLFELVSKGDKLAEYIPPTKGVFGYDVRGKLLVPKNGRPRMPLRGKGFIVSEDGNEYFAAIDGKVEYRNTDLNVLNVLRISSDVDMSVGNINFNGDVEILGNVLGGMTIRAKGNICISGFVEDAFIKSEKDIVFKSGVNGKGVGMVSAQGTINARFLENVQVFAKGDIYADYILNSNVTSNGKVYVDGKRGTIHGGVVTGVLGVESKMIGNESYVSTMINVGATNAVRGEYGMVLDKLKEINTEIDTFDIILEKLENVKQVCPEKYDKEMYSKTFQSKIIKLSEKKKYEELSKEYIRLLGEGGRSTVVIKKTLFPGAKIFINGYVYETETPMNEMVVRFNGEKAVAASIKYNGGRNND